MRDEEGREAGAGGDDASPGTAVVVIVVTLVAFGATVAIVGSGVLDGTGPIDSSLIDDGTDSAFNHTGQNGAGSEAHENASAPAGERSERERNQTSDERPEIDDE
ncbi:hypothetical protein [Natronobiforma cellulositropha]|uniref:hypothetical protein n=1 Tax=Natronobiforma cellulositropha TaxID=1679076 RepID=UPI0021D56D8C|nr:hypothetical protein [Natronobiforma cellulositropha]